MSIEQAEQLKTELTDKWVVVDKNVPELRRFAGLTGKVKTVNMNCQALVEFIDREDIGWYDIGTTFLTVVDKPVAKPKVEAKAEAPKAAAGGAKKPAAGGSPLDMIRKQGAPGAKKPAAGGSPLDQIRKQGAPGSKPAVAAADGGKKLSPLEQIRQQGAAGKAAAAPAEEAANAPAEAPVAEKKTPAADSGKKLSPLEMIRKQGPAKS
ncbi:MAG: hypothetical protein HQ518_10095 [Rhodopirellula sp.]|nr:hypothetical protein [Rhodopirellula sp.]